MRWPQFLLTLINLGFSLYLLLSNVFFSDYIDPATFLWTLIYTALSLAIAHLYMLYMTNKIDDWYDVESMKGITNLSIVALVICLGAVAYQIGYDYYHKKVIVDTNPDSLRRLVPLVAALICSLVIFSSSIKFKKYIILCRSVDLQTAAAAAHKRNYQTTSN